MHPIENIIKTSMEEINRMADVNTVIDVILSNAHNMDADVNGDHEVNIADVNAEIDMILNK